jgi:hypothetical protein
MKRGDAGVGRSLTAINTVSGPPDTRLTRCAYLWQYASQLLSSNGLGTLREVCRTAKTMRTKSAAGAAGALVATGQPTSDQ